MMGKLFTNSYLKEEKGAALLSAVLIVLVITMLGVALLTMTTSNLKQTGMEREHQAVYYIAEAGANWVINEISIKVNELSEVKLSHKDFFAELDDYIGSLGTNYNDFEVSFGEQPEATVNVETSDKLVITWDEENGERYSKAVKTYTITSKGEIAGLSRSVTAAIQVGHGIKKEPPGHHPSFDYVLFSGGQGALTTQSASNIDGNVYAYEVDIEPSKSKINGNIISETSVELGNATTINGNIYAMGGYVKLESSKSKITGDIHATGDVTFGNGTSLTGNIYANGEIKLKDSNVSINGDIHSEGNVELGHGGNVNAIYTRGNIEFGGRNTINGDINSHGSIGVRNNSGSNVTIGGNIFSGDKVTVPASKAWKIHGNVNAMGTIEIGTGNEIRGDAVSKKDVKANPQTVRGEIIQSGDPTGPKAPQAPSFEDLEDLKLRVSPPDLTPIEPATNKDKDIEVPPTSSGEHYKGIKGHHIQPGVYGNLSIGGWNSRVILSSGTYVFNTINLAKSGHSLYLDLSNGPINVYSKGDINHVGDVYLFVEEKQQWIKMDDLVQQEKEKAIELAGKVYWETHGKFAVTKDGGNEHRQWFGTVLANNKITIPNGANLIGAFVVREGKIDFESGSQTTILYAPPTISAAGSSGSNDNSDGENDQGQNIISQEFRIKIVSPVREAGN